MSRITITTHDDYEDADGELFTISGPSGTQRTSSTTAVLRAVAEVLWGDAPMTLDELIEAGLVRLTEEVPPAT